MLRTGRTDENRAQSARRLKDWTRQRFALSDEMSVFVSEVSCGLPGCPPIETVVAFWTAPDRRHDFKLFKPLAEVCEADLPPRWMRDRLLWDGIEADCC